MGTTQIQNIDILFGTIILFGFIILFAMAFGFVWLQDRIYDKFRRSGKPRIYADLFCGPYIRRLYKCTLM